MYIEPNCTTPIHQIDSGKRDFTSFQRINLKLNLWAPKQSTGSTGHGHTAQTKRFVKDDESPERKRHFHEVQNCDKVIVLCWHGAGQRILFCFWVLFVGTNKNNQKTNGKMLLGVLIATCLHVVCASDDAKLGKVKRINPMDTNEIRVWRNFMW